MLESLDDRVSLVRPGREATGEDVDLGEAFIMEQGGGLVGQGAEDFAVDDEGFVVAEGSQAEVILMKVYGADDMGLVVGADGARIDEEGAVFQDVGGRGVEGGDCESRSVGLKRMKGETAGVVDAQAEGRAEDQDEGGAPESPLQGSQIP